MKTLTLFLTAILTLLVPIKGLILIVIGAVLLDTITGVYTSIKLGGRTSFRSGKLFNFIVKIVFYSVAIILGFFIDKYIFGGEILSIPFLLSKSACLISSYIELKSVDENSQKIGNRPILDIIKEMIKGLKKIKKDINEIKS